MNSKLREADAIVLTEINAHSSGDAIVLARDANMMQMRALWQLGLGRDLCTIVEMSNMFDRLLGAHLVVVMA